MPPIGKTSSLQVVKEVDFGLYLDGGDLGEILLPAQYVSAEYRLGDWLDVFIYLDSEDRVIATTEKPYAELGECAYMKVVDVASFGAFLDWGLAKNLLVPFREQRVTMQENRSYVVYVYEDKTGRICASSKLDRFLSEQSEGQFKRNQKVNLLICGGSPLGYKAVIDGTHLGLLFNSDVLTPLNVGQRITGYIKNIRAEDDAIDLMLQQQGTELHKDLTQRILQDLEERGGTSTLTDKSSADEIFSHYQVSKKNYKKALGQLYTHKKIVIDKDKITLA